MNINYRSAKSGQHSSEPKYPSRIFLKNSSQLLPLSEIECILVGTLKKNRPVYSRYEANVGKKRRLQGIFNTILGKPPQMFPTLMIF